MRLSERFGKVLLWPVETLGKGIIRAGKIVAKPLSRDFWQKDDTAAARKEPGVLWRGWTALKAYDEHFDHIRAPLARAAATGTLGGLAASMAGTTIVTGVKTLGASILLNPFMAIPTILIGTAGAFIMAKATARHLGEANDNYRVRESLRAARRQWDANRPAREAKRLARMNAVRHALRATIGLAGAAIATPVIAVTGLLAAGGIAAGVAGLAAAGFTAYTAVATATPAVLLTSLLGMPGAPLAAAAATAAGSVAAGLAGYLSAKIARRAVTAAYRGNEGLQALGRGIAWSWRAGKKALKHKEHVPAAPDAAPDTKPGAPDSKTLPAHAGHNNDSNGAEQSPVQTIADKRRVNREDGDGKKNDPYADLREEFRQSVARNPEMAAEIKKDFSERVAERKRSLGL